MLQISGQLLLLWASLQNQIMRNRSIYRGILIVAGFLAAAVIILSYSPSTVSTLEKKAATEKTDATESDTMVIVAPTVVAPQTGAVAVDKHVPESLLEILGAVETSEKFLPVVTRAASVFFKTLFSVLIAPNAP